MARRRNAARSIFHTAVGPERRVVDSPDIEPRIAMVPDEAWNWIEPAHVRKAAVQVPVDGRDRELAEREAAILKAMAKATLPEQRELLAELNGIRAEKTARLAASRELDLANATVADHLTPIVSMGSRSTAKSDWLDDVPALTPGDMSHDMIVEAAMFWRDTHVAVKADAQELVEQAKGRARVVASRFEAQAPAARRIFMEEIVRLAAAHPAQEPAADGVAKSTLPVAVNPSDAPETFDTNTLSAEDREALHDSQMADSDFAQKYQSSRVIAAINETMWARLAGFETEDDEGYDAKEKQRQSETDDTKDEGAAEDTSGDEKKKNPFGKADDTDESDDSGGTETPVKGEVDDSGKPWEKKDASRRTAADEPAPDGAAESSLPVAINPSDAPEGLDQLNENPQPATGMVGEGSGPAPQAAAAGGPTTFNDFVKDHSKAAAFRARVQSNLQASRRPFVREAADDWKQRQDAADAIAREMGISEGEMRSRVSAYISEEVLGPDSGEGISSSDVNHTIYGLMYGDGSGLRRVLTDYADWQGRDWLFEPRRAVRRTR